MSVRHAVLGLLAQRPRHGYELHAAFEAVVGGQENWDVKPAQIYSTLTRLQESGLVAERTAAPEENPEKRVYAITPQGNAVLGEWFNSAVERDHGRDEFFVKFMLALVTEHVEPGRLIQLQRSRLFQDLHELTLLRSRADPQHELARMLLYDKAIMHLEADLRWLDMTETRLTEICRQPLPEPDLRPRGRPRKIENRNEHVTSSSPRPH